MFVSMLFHQWHARLRQQQEDQQRRAVRSRTSGPFRISGSNDNGGEDGDEDGQEGQEGLLERQERERDELLERQMERELDRELLEDRDRDYEREEDREEDDEEEEEDEVRGFIFCLLIPYAVHSWCILTLL